MAFTSPTWSTGDQVSSTKLGQMVTNEEHVRDEVGVRHVLTLPGPQEGAPSCDNGVTISLGGTLLDTISTAAGDDSMLNESISSYSRGLQELEIVVQNAHTSDYTYRQRIYLTADMLYLTVFATLAGGEITKLDVFVTREAVSW